MNKPNITLTGCYQPFQSNNIIDIALPMFMRLILLWWEIKLNVVTEDSLTNSQPHPPSILS